MLGQTGISDVAIPYTLYIYVGCTGGLQAILLVTSGKFRFNNNSIHYEEEIIHWSTCRIGDASAGKDEGAVTDHKQGHHALRKRSLLPVVGR